MNLVISFSVHGARHDRRKGEIVPVISSVAFITGEATLRLDPKDPFCWGIRA
jgi:4-hydroxyproline epimerase